MKKHDDYIEKQLANLGKRITALRKAKGYSNYEQFAYENEINRSQYGRYENTTSVLRTSANRRRDIQYDGTLGLNWRIDSNWSLRPSISYTRNNSNVPIYAWDRADASLMLRRDFQ